MINVMYTHPADMFTPVVKFSMDQAHTKHPDFIKYLKSTSDSGLLPLARYRRLKMRQLLWITLTPDEEK